MKTKIFLFTGMLTILLCGIHKINYAQTNEVIIGTGTNLTRQVPINRNANYSRCEIIYTKNEIGRSGKITSISFYKGNTEYSGEITNVKVYLKHTSQRELQNGNWSNRGYSEVFNSTIPNDPLAGWRTIILPEPFYYNDNENLSMTIEHGYQLQSDNFPQWQYTQLSNNNTRCRSANSNNSLPDRLQERSTRPNIKIDFEPSSPETNDYIVGNGSKGSKLFPINRQTNYSRWEGLYTAQEIGTAGNIYSLSFFKDNITGAGDITNIRVYMKHTPQPELSNGSWSSTGYTEVYYGTLTNGANSGWRTIELTRPFKYNGTDNLVITIDHGYQNFTNNYPEWQYTKLQNDLKRSRAGQSDNNLPNNLGFKSGRPNIKLEMGCKYPTAHAGEDKYLCMADSITLGDSITATGGFRPYKYVWEPPDGLNNPTTEHPVTFAKDSIAYSLIVLDSLDCKSKPDYVFIDVSTPKDQYAFKKDTTISVCQGYFFDSGGEKNEYKYNEDYTVTMYPCDVYNKLTINFLKFDLEYSKTCNDYLKIYDGPNTTSPLIGTYCGLNAPGYINSTNPDGALTFVFHSDKDVTASGWVAEIKCVEKSCTELAGTPVITFGGDQCTPGEATISLTNNLGTFLKWEFSFNNIDFKDLPDGNMYPYHTYVKTTTYFRALVAGNGKECYTSSAVFRTGKKYYVNDRDITNDIYCTTTGSDKLDGLSPKTPKEFVQSILDSYDVTSCDTIFVDAGNYEKSINITASDFGSSDASIVITGASQELTTISAPVSDIVLLKDASFIKITNLSVLGTSYTNNCISIVSSNNIDINSCLVTKANMNNIYILGEKFISDNNSILNNYIGPRAGRGIELNKTAVRIEGKVMNNLISGNTLIQNKDVNIPAISVNAKSGLQINNINISKNIISSIEIGISVISGGLPGLISNISVSENTVTIEKAENMNGGCLVIEYVSDTLKVFNNRFIGGFAGINYLKTIDKSVVYNNYISRSQFGIIGTQDGISHKIYFNSFYNVKSNLSFSTTPDNKWYLKDNIFYATTGSCIKVMNFPEFAELDYNLYYNENGSVITYNNGGNIFNTLSEWKNNAHQNWPGKEDEHSVYGDPLYVDLVRNNLDIEYASPANFAGLLINGYPFDIYKHQRKDPPAIGAFDPVISDFSCTFVVSPVKLDALGHISFKILGGIPPYQITYSQDTISVQIADILLDSLNIDSSEYSRERFVEDYIKLNSNIFWNNLESGIYNIKIKDNSGNTAYLSIPVYTESYWNTPILSELNITENNILKIGADGWSNGMISMYNEFNTSSKGKLYIDDATNADKFFVGFSKKGNEVKSIGDIDYGFLFDNDTIYVYQKNVITDIIQNSSGNIKLAFTTQNDEILFSNNEQLLYSIQGIETGSYSTYLFLYSSNNSLQGVASYSNLNYGITYEKLGPSCINNNDGKIKFNFNIPWASNIFYQWSGTNAPLQNVNSATGLEFGYYDVTVNYTVPSGQQVNSIFNIYLPYRITWFGNENVNTSLINNDLMKFNGTNSMLPLTDAGAFSMNRVKINEMGKIFFSQKNNVNENIQVGFSSLINISDKTIDNGVRILKFNITLLGTTMTYRWILAILKDVNGNNISQLVSNNYSDASHKIEINKSGNNQMSIKIDNNLPLIFNNLQFANNNCVKGLIGHLNSKILNSHCEYECMITPEVYYVLSKNIDGSCYTPINNMIPFKYEEEYYKTIGLNLIYQLYSEANQSVSIPVFPIKYGDNRYQLNLPSGITQGYYYLKVNNDKEESWLLKFKVQ